MDPLKQKIDPNFSFGKLDHIKVVTEDGTEKSIRDMNRKDWHKLLAFFGQATSATLLRELEMEEVHQGLIDKLGGNPSEDDN